MPSTPHLDAQPADPAPSPVWPVELSLSGALVRDLSRTFRTRMRGDTLRGVGILDGDLQAVEDGTPPRNGDVVVLRVDGVQHLRVYRTTRDGRANFQAAQPGVADLHLIHGTRFGGTVVSVARSLWR